jgi:hypothetical protein
MCGSSRHGWLGYLERAAGGPEAVKALNDSAEQLWWDQKKRHKEKGDKKPTKYLQQAGGTVTLAALVSWLADDEAARERISKLGHGLPGAVFDRDLRQYAAERAREDPDFANFGSATVGHFWCDLLTEIANVLDGGADLFGKLPAAAQDALFQEDDAAAWAPVRAELAEAALGFLWTCLQLFTQTDPGALALQLRVLAVLICPDPGGHPRVARDCLHPLVAENLGESLGVNLDPDWLWGRKS